MFERCVSVLVAVQLLASLFLPIPLSTAAFQAGADEQASSSFLIRKRVVEVQATFTVRDRHGHEVSDVEQANVEVFQDGEKASVIWFRQAQDVPLRLMLLVDTSDSMGPGLRDAARTAEELVKEFVRPDVDSLMVQSFATEGGPRHSGSPQIVTAAFRGIRAEGQTSLYDTIFDTCQALESSGSGPERRVILLLSDGEDTWSHHALQDTIAMAQRANVSIYAVTAHSRRLVVRGDDVLRQMAEETGGEAIILHRYGQLEGAFSNVARDLRTHYVVGFRPSENPGRFGFHPLKILVDKAGATVRARAGYYSQ